MNKEQNTKLKGGVILLILLFQVLPIIKIQGQPNITWPSLPVLNIETVDGVMPTRTIVSAPEGCTGVSITDNDYIPGRMTMTLNGNDFYDSGDYIKGESGMRIKIRGNSTGAYLNQFPYKIKLSKKYDLLRRNYKEFKHKEWLLMSMYTWNSEMTNQESNILNIAGSIVSKIVHKEWVPEYDFVNVVINEQYQGMYYLMEAVEKGDKRINIDDTGFLLEHDTFWWNEVLYFKTDYQNYATGYTYKYPDEDDVTDSIQTVLKDYLNEFEKVLYANGDISKYIDMESFAKWILIHDILGSTDEAGCNRFICKHDMNKDNVYSSKIEMGPAWDFDSSFKSKGWSNIHQSSSWFYYSKLFERKDFQQIYYHLWQVIRPTILSAIQEGFDEVWNKYGDVFDESMKIHQTKYPSEGHQSFKSQIDEVITKLTERIYLLDELMKQYNQTDDIIIALQENHLEGITDIIGRCYNTTDIHQLPQGIYILHYNSQKSKKIVVR